MDKNQIISEIDQYWVQQHFDKEQRDFFINLLLDLKPKYCLETGFETGTSSTTILASSKPKKLISVSKGANMKVAEKLEENYNFKLIKGDSTKILTAEFFKKEYPNGIDFYHVDGGHTFQVAKADLDNAYPYMNKGSIIIIDDFYSKVCSLIAVNKAVETFSKEQNKKIEKIQLPAGKGMALIKL